MKYTPRAIEPHLRRLAAAHKAVLVTGARQVGKSTLLRHLFPDRRYVTLDDPFLEEQAKTDGRFFLSLNPPPVTVDEIQRAPELFRHVKMLCDESDAPGQFLLTGSQPYHLMQGVSESLSGRVAVLELHGLSLRERRSDSFAERFVPTEDYLRRRAATAAPLAPADLWRTIHRGSFPGLPGDARDWSAFHADYLRTYVERDIRALDAVQDLSAFRRFVVAAAARTGQMLNHSAIASEIGKDLGTVKRWMSLLEAAGLVILLEAFAPSALRRAIRTPKLYFLDTGLAAYLTRWLTPGTLAAGAMSGPLFETFAVSEIVKSFANAGLDWRHHLSYYRGRDRRKLTRGGTEREVESEIDLVIEEDGVLYPVEIKRSSSVTADAAAAFPTLDAVSGRTLGTGAVLCPCPQPARLRDNLYAVPIWYV